MSDLELLESAARVMAGKPVKVYVRDFDIEGAGGASYIDEAGQAVVELKPDRSDGFTLYALCHECCHHAAGHTQPVKSGDITRLKVDHQAWHEDVRERDTDQAAQVWLEYAEGRVLYYRGSWLERRLKAISGRRHEVSYED